MKRILAIMMIFALFITGCGLKDSTGKFVEETENTYVAIINGEEVAKDYFDRQYKMIQNRYAMFGMELTERQLLDEAIIPQVILVQAAREIGVEVNNAEVNEFVNAEMDKIQESLSEEQLALELENLGITWQELKDDNKIAYKNQLYITRLLNITVWQGIEVTDKEIEAYYDDNQDTFQTGNQIQASHILVETQEEADDIMTMLEDGEDFAELAEEYSQDPGSAVNGGDLGFFGKGMMVPEFEEVAFSLDIDEISEPVATQFGFHIIMVTDTQEASELKLSEVRNQIEEQLMIAKQKSAEEAFIAELIDASEIEIFLAEEVETAPLEEELITFEETTEE